MPTCFLYLCLVCGWAERKIRNEKINEKLDFNVPLLPNSAIYKSNHLSITNESAELNRQEKLVAERKFRKILFTATFHSHLNLTEDFPRAS